MTTNENTTIQVSRETWRKLSRLKIDLQARDLEEVVNKLLKILTKFKLGSEIKELK